MEQRLCLAHALVHDPQVLLLDEPASGLDPRARVELRELLRELRSLGKTILISSHILPELEELCTSVAIVDRGRVLAKGAVSDIERRLRYGAVLRVRVLAEGEALEAARASLEADPDVTTATILRDGTIELGFRGDDAASARLLATAVAAGLPIVSFARAATDLEELFLQVTGPGSGPVGSGGRSGMTDPIDPVQDVATEVAPVETSPVTTGSATAAPAQATTPPRRIPGPSSLLLRTAGGVGAVGVKELRGRMRGRRAFAILSGYLVLLAVFAWMVELMMERTYSTSFGSSATFASAAIGQGIFAAVLMLETLVVVFLATMATAGAISLEREKQTLEMLAATPITSFAIVLGKLLSALIYVWLLIAASIPLTAIVFVFGGVGPDDLVRGYVVLIVTALGFGAFGLFCSSLVKRTQAATAIALFGVLAISMGTLFVILFWTSLATPVAVRDSGTLKGAPPDFLTYINPFIAQADIAPADVLCATDSTLNAYCKFRSTFVLPTTGIVFGADVNSGGTIQVDVNSGGGIAPAIAIDPALLPAKGGAIPAIGPIPIGIDGRLPLDVAPGSEVVAFGSTNTSIWERTVVAWSVLSVVFLILSVQFVSPTRRWHLRRGRSSSSPETGR